MTFAFDIFDKVRSGQRLSIPEGCPFTNVITKCWDPQPALRPEFLDAYTMLKEIKEQAITFAAKEDLIDKRTISTSNSFLPAQAIAATFGGKVKKKNWNIIFVFNDS